MKLQPHLEAIDSRRRWRALAAAALGIVLAFAARDARAGKPPAEQPPPGVVYFRSNTPEGSRDLYSMLGDGSDKTLVFQEFFDDVFNSYTCPSQLPHGGARWFLKFIQIETETYPDGAPRTELFAVSDAGVFVQLTEDPTLEPVRSGQWAADVQWAVGDTVVSWLARRWGIDGGGAPTIAEMGIYYILLDAEVSAGPTLAAPEMVPIESYPSHDGLWPDDCGFGWSPDGASVAFAGQDPEMSGLFAADVVTGAVTRLSSSPAMNPRWSPDGTRIAFWWWTVGIETVFADGTGEATLVQNALTATSRTEHRLPFWSPDGSHLVYIQMKENRKTGHANSTVFRIPSGGGAPVDLTGSTRDWVCPMGWAADSQP
jgi:hypothetical protein